MRQAMKFLHEGGLGPIYMARGLCYKPRPPIGKYPDGPMATGEKYTLTVNSTNYEPTYDAEYLTKVDYDLWLGPAPKRPFNRNRFHYNWHWHWDYGNGDTGNQGPHQFDIARWGLGKNEHPVKISSAGGYYGSGVVSGDARHADVAVRVRGRQGARVRHARAVHQRRRRAAHRQPLLRSEGLALARRNRTQLAVLLRGEEREGAGLRNDAARARVQSRAAGRITRTSSTRFAPTTRRSSRAT